LVYTLPLSLSAPLPHTSTLNGRGPAPHPGRRRRLAVRAARAGRVRHRAQGAADTRSAAGRLQAVQVIGGGVEGKGEEGRGGGGLGARSQPPPVRPAALRAHPPAPLQCGCRAVKEAGTWGWPGGARVPCFSPSAASPPTPTPTPPGPTAPKNCAASTAPCASPTAAAATSSASWTWGPG